MPDKASLLQRVALGSAQFGLPYGVAHSGPRVSQAEAHAIVDEAARLGVRVLDTAMAYGNSEEVLGRHGLKGWQVVSKLPALPSDCPDVLAWVQQSVAQSLERLQVPRLHGLLLHRPGQLLETQGPALLAALRAVQAQGLVHKIGPSIYSPDELAPLMALHPFEMVQAPASILDQRLHHSGWAQRLHAAGVEVHTRSANLQGLLLSPQVQAQRFAAWQPLWTYWHGWLASEGLTSLQACIRYALAQPHVSQVVLGFDSVAQLRDMAEAAAGPALNSLPDWPAFDERLLNPSLWTPA